MATAIQLPDNVLKARRNFSFSRPFTKAATDDYFTLSGTAAALDERGAGISLTTAASDNAIAYAISNGKWAELAADKPLYLALQLRYAEANTNSANVFVGLFSTTVATCLGDNGAGIPANFSGIGLYKTDGGTANWTAFVSNATVQTKVELNATNSLDKIAHPAATGAAVNQLIEFDIIPQTATKAIGLISIDGKPVYKFTDWATTSLAAMALLAAIKSGSTTAEVLKAKRCDFSQVL